MKLVSFFVAMAAIIVTSEACKCGGAANNVDATRACCRNVGGVPNSQNDCPAGQISERLSNFHRCCLSFGSRSDCRCPVGCFRQELQATRAKEGVPPLTDTEMLEALDDYDF